MNIPLHYGEDLRVANIALADRYKQILNEMFSGVVVLDVPWADSTFRGMFHNRLHNMRVAADDARKWDAIKELFAQIGVKR